MILINVTEKPIDSKHVCYFTKLENNILKLYQVIENTYKHPNAPDDAYIQKIEINYLKEYNIYFNESVHLRNLHDANLIVERIENDLEKML